MTIEERLESLERERGGLNRQLRQLRAVLGLALCALFAALIIAATPDVSREIRSTRFVLEDASGKECGVLAMTKDGPGLFLLDEAGKSRVALAATGNGPSLVLRDANNKPRVSIATTQIGPGMALFDADGSVLGSVGMTKDGPALFMSDEVRQALWASQW